MQLKLEKGAECPDKLLNSLYYLILNIIPDIFLQIVNGNNVSPIIFRWRITNRFNVKPMLR